MTNQEPAYLISRAADRLLSEISKKFGDDVLSAAVKQARRRSGDLAPIVAPCDIEKAVREIEESE